MRAFGPIEFSTLGFDPGLRHGALVYTRWRCNDEVLLIPLDYKVIYSWNEKSPVALTMKATASEVGKLAQEMAKAIDEIPYTGLTVGIDWTAISGHFATKKIQTATTGFFTGYVTRMFHEKGVSTAFFAPSSVRSKLGLNSNVDKNTALDSVARRLKIKPNFKNDKHQDKADGFILAYVTALAYLDKYASGEIQ